MQFIVLCINLIKSKMAYCPYHCSAQIVSWSSCRHFRNKLQVKNTSYWHIKESLSPLLDFSRTLLWLLFDSSQESIKVVYWTCQIVTLVMAHFFVKVSTFTKVFRSTLAGEKPCVKVKQASLSQFMNYNKTINNM